MSGNLISLECDAELRLMLAVCVRPTIDPGQPAITGRSPEDCQPGWPAGVECPEVVQVFEAEIWGPSDEVLATRRTADGTMSAAFASQLTRVFLRRYNSDPEVRAEVGARCMAQVRD